MKNTDKFSVLMCVYALDDAKKFINAFNSIYFEQTIKPDEIIIVIDGSLPPELSDTVENVISSCPAVKIIKLNENLGRGEARRIGMLACTMPLVAVMDADDLSVSERFELQLECYRKDPSLSIVGGYIEELSSEKGISHRLIRTVPLNDSDIRRGMKDRSPFNHITIMMRRDDVIAAGNYSGHFESEDYDLFFRMEQKGFRFLNLPMVLCVISSDKNMYRRRGGWHYFKSEASQHIEMYKCGFISFPRLIYNIALRFVVHSAAPNSFRIILYRIFARKSKDKRNSSD
ncbi:UDP-Gal:alpha-D-GlcNAc-diphosphoundecaprenol beta-1,3-galactosyltransferase [bioreactor metagenome]|uniref:UDP-Gal:alpha-D-GlcNAc-diphosphoundecaprenol beta-1,3-galactosyltransferase n=1 Tax=bioreactor metagenome TaxID=1076179 RepID=A0A645AQA6_9ZZZZ|nr:glycosyltransferase [Oscillospiraceae bacterium]